MKNFIIFFNSILEKFSTCDNLIYHRKNNFAAASKNLNFDPRFVSKFLDTLTNRVFFFHKGNARKIPE